MLLPGKCATSSNIKKGSETGVGSIAKKKSCSRTVLLIESESPLLGFADCLLFFSSSLNVVRARAERGHLVFCERPRSARNNLRKLDSVVGCRAVFGRPGYQNRFRDRLFPDNFSSLLRYLTLARHSLPSCVLNQTSWVLSAVCSIPACMLPAIVSSSEVYCVAENPDYVLNGVRIAGILGDQQVNYATTEVNSLSDFGFLHPDRARGVDLKSTSRPILAFFFSRPRGASCSSGGPWTIVLKGFKIWCIPTIVG